MCQETRISNSSGARTIGNLAIRFLGGAGTVTGSKFLVEAGNRRLLIDCGLFQGLKELRLRNWDRLPVDPESLDWVVLTHGHIDHTGYLPRLIKDGFSGPVHATRATADLLKIMLPDSGHLQEEDADYHNRHGTSKHTPALPLYTAAEGQRAADRVIGVRYLEPLELAPGIRVQFRGAGHILGSAIVGVELDQGGRGLHLVFSGDLGRTGAPILPEALPVGAADYVIIESTYGDRRHASEPIPRQIERVINEAVRRDGAVVMPAFAIGRTQELLYFLSALEQAGRIPRLPTYVDSPMAIEAMAVYQAHREDLERTMQVSAAARAFLLQSRDVHFVRTPAESKAINAIRGPVLIIAASGMATGGRVLHHLKLRLPDPRTTVLLVGYQAEGTRGRLLQDGAASVRMFGEDVPVRATVEAIHGLSAHADADGLMRWLRTAERRPKRVCVVHGEPAAAAALAMRVRSELGWETTIPAYLDRLALD